jgi:hypothetical protein
MTASLDRIGNPSDNGTKASAFGPKRIIGLPHPVIRHLAFLIVLVAFQL